MAYLLKYNGKSLDFGDYIYVVNWEGAGFDDVISTTPLIGDGSHVDGSRHSERQIIIRVRVFNEPQKQLIYSIFEGRKNGTLQYLPELDKSQAKEIDCIVKSIIPLASAYPMDLQVILLCPYPFWRALSQTSEIISGTVGMLEFPLELPKEKALEFGKVKSGKAIVFNYSGLVPTGFSAVVFAYEAISKIKLYSHYTQEYLEIKGDYPVNSEFVICTETGKRKIWHRYGSQEEYTDISGDVVWGSTFFSIVPGSNRINVDVDGGAYADTSIEFTIKYGGV